MTAICLLAVVLALVILSFERDGDGRKEPVVWDLAPVKRETGASAPTTRTFVRLELLPATGDLERVRRAA
jgi:hypothetical protein